MKLHTKFSFLLLAVLLLFKTASFAQEKTDKDGYYFTDKIDLNATPVKNQYRSGTCWSFSGISYVESELLRTGKGEYNLSEMFIVRNTYLEKAIKYVRVHGNLNFAGGGQFHDVINMIKKYGIVPEEAYPGLLPGEKKHIHGEMDEVLKDYVDGVIKNKNRKLSKAWIAGFNGILDAYLGKVPGEFTYKGKSYTPKSFAASLELNWNDYVNLTSYTHHPFYETFGIEIPDNWAWGQVYNLPIGELMSVVDNALENGYTIGWASDVSEKGFSWKNGIAIVPDKAFEDLNDLEQGKWSTMTKGEKDDLLYHKNKPGAEKVITQTMRQEAFDNYETTDDHGMHITGTATDQNGNLYYKVKNSWGNAGQIYDGYFYASKAFVTYKTMAILINKNAIPKAIRKKLDL